MYSHFVFKSEDNEQSDACKLITDKVTNHLANYFIKNKIILSILTKLFQAPLETL